LAVEATKPAPCVAGSTARRLLPLHGEAPMQIG